MDFDQIVRLIVLLIALIYFIRKPKPKKEEIPRKKRLREEALKQEVSLKKASAKTLHIQVKKEPKTFKLEEHQFQTSIEKRTFETNLEARYSDPYGKRLGILNLSHQADAPKYNVLGKKGNSKGRGYIFNLRSKKEMIILQEIISPPKSLTSLFKIF